jgi:hypothetical protein
MKRLSIYIARVFSLREIALRLVTLLKNKILCNWRHEKPPSALLDVASGYMLVPIRNGTGTGATDHKREPNRPIGSSLE